MKKNLITVVCLFFACSFLLNTQVFAYWNTYVTLQIDNPYYINRASGPLRLDENDPSVRPIIHEGRAMLPLRAVASIIPLDGPGYYVVDWYESERKAVLIERCQTNPSRHQPVADFWIGSTSAVFYDSSDQSANRVTISSAPIIVNGRTYLPLRAVADAIGWDIEWVESKRGIVVYYRMRPSGVLFPDGSRMD